MALIRGFAQAGYRQWALLNGAVLFYTCLPLPRSWPVEFDGIARFAPVVGIAIGAGLAGIDWGLGLALSPILRSALVVLAGIWVTGGLHMDGAMDTADGLAVPDRERRLEVMSDSRSGAFGVMVAIAIILLKTLALATLVHHRWAVLISAAAWGRWGQQWAIGSYPYLKPQGKGAFHKQAMPTRWHTAPCAMGLVGLTVVATWTMHWLPWNYGLIAMAMGLSSGPIVASWLNRRLGGHTGDTYGAVVEWVEVAVLVGLASIVA